MKMKSTFFFIIDPTFILPKGTELMMSATGSADIPAKTFLYLHTPLETQASHRQQTLQS